MKDNLLDLIQHTNGLGVIELLKVVGSDTETKITALAEDKTVVVNGTFQKPIADFIGTFGMPNLGTLKTILSFDEYDDTAVISVNKNKDGELSSIHFETASRDFVSDYRLMAKNTIEDRVKPVTFKGATWHVEFEPTVEGIAKLKKQSQANSTENTFTIKSEGNDIRLYFGDPSNHSGNFVFATGCGKLTKAWSYPIKVFTSIVDLPGDKKVRFSDQGAAEVTVDSGIANYQYLFPAQQK
jgi:hypothetical protein